LHLNRAIKTIVLEKTMKNILEKVTDGLKVEPAYLFVFGICVLFSIGSGIGIAYPQGNTVDKIIALIGFALSLAGALFTVYMVAKRGEPLPTPPATEGVFAGKDIADEAFAQLARSINMSIIEGLKFPSKLFREAMHRDLVKWSRYAHDWREGKYVAQREYNSLLLGAYRDAEQDVFCTSLPEYLETWNTNFGKSLLEAHEKGKANVTRVFVFDRESDVKDEHLTILKDHVSNHPQIKSLIYFDDQQDVFKYPTFLSRDFTVIDGGKAIAITAQFQRENLVASWYFDGPDRENPTKVIVNGVKGTLLDRSERLKDWLNRREVSE
jgi:hypothetical protein